MKQLSDYPCEVCGAPATNAVRDMYEADTLDGWKHCHPKGPPHFFCDEHERDSEIELLSWNMYCLRGYNK